MNNYRPQSPNISCTTDQFKPDPHPVQPLEAREAGQPIAPTEMGETSALGTGIEVKTKFPVARIKRIMQADEDVGKVAQVTPIAVCMYSYRACVTRRDTVLTYFYSQGPRTLYDFSRHQGRTRSQGS